MIRTLQGTGLGATFPLDGSADDALRSLQQQLVRLGFLNRATGVWSWDTYAAIGYADKYITSLRGGSALSRQFTVHAATNSVDIADDWIAALRAAPQPPAGTSGLWADIPHRATWPRTVAVAGGALVLLATGLGIGAWLWRRRRSR